MKGSNKLLIAIISLVMFWIGWICWRSEDPDAWWLYLGIVGLFVGMYLLFDIIEYFIEEGDHVIGPFGLLLKWADKYLSD